MIKHLQNWIPFWNSLDAVRRIHSDFELASIIFFALLAGFDALAHWEKDKAKERRFAGIGVWCFVIAIVCEAIAYPYGQRNDELSEKVITSLSDKAKQAFDDASSARTKAAEAKGDALEAKTVANGVAIKAEVLEQRLGVTSAKLEKTENSVRTQGPRWRILEDHKADFIKALKPYAGQKYIVNACSPQSAEQSRLWMDLEYLLGHPDGAGWQLMDTKFSTIGCLSTSVTYSLLVKDTKAPAEALADELNRLGMISIISRQAPLPPPTTRPELMGMFRGSASEALWKDRSLIIISIGENQMFTPSEYNPKIMVPKK